eukprot:scaffold3531_cov235-Ochromonas_danica.AAC.3
MDVMMMMMMMMMMRLMMMRLLVMVIISDDEQGQENRERDLQGAPPEGGEFRKFGIPELGTVPQRDIPWKDMAESTIL